MGYDWKVAVEDDFIKLTGTGPWEMTGTGHWKMIGAGPHI